MHSRSYGMKPSPCTPECTKRKMHCHSGCEEYKDWAAEREVRRAEYVGYRRRERRLEDHFAEFAIKARKRWKT